MFEHTGEVIRAENVLRSHGITFHYLFPDVDWHNMALMAVQALEPHPLPAVAFMTPITTISAPQQHKAGPESFQPCTAKADARKKRLP